MAALNKKDAIALVAIFTLAAHPTTLQFHPLVEGDLEKRLAIGIVAR